MRPNLDVSEGFFHADLSLNWFISEYEEPVELQRKSRDLSLMAELSRHRSSIPENHFLHQTLSDINKWGQSSSSTAS